MKSLVLLTFLLAGYGALFPVIDGYSKGRLGEKDVRYIPQKELIELSMLEFKNLAADMLFFEALTYAGGRKSGKDNPETWQWVYKTLDASAHLNPYNVDPYFMAQGFLTWKGRMFEETNALLNRGITFRKNDWRIPFFIGFNYYYFLDQPEMGAKYLELAAQMPDSPKLTLIMLVSRLYSQAARTELAITIVRDDYEKATDEGLRRAYKVRLESLHARLKIEHAVQAYENIYKHKPKSLDVLVAKNLLKEIPADPEGGNFFLDARGRVKNTREAEVGKKAEM